MANDLLQADKGWVARRRARRRDAKDGERRGEAKTKRELGRAARESPPFLLVNSKHDSKQDQREATRHPSPQASKTRVLRARLGRTMDVLSRPRSNALLLRALLRNS